MISSVSPVPARLAAYCGLVPSTRASRGKSYQGRLLPLCNKWLRWALGDAAWASMRSSAYCRAHFAMRQRQKGDKTALISLSRRLSAIIWHVWKEQRVYEERPLLSGQRVWKDKTAPAALAHV
jgi:transposase